MNQITVQESNLNLISVVVVAFFVNDFVARRIDLSVLVCCFQKLPEQGFFHKVTCFTIILPCNVIFKIDLKRQKVRAG